MIALGVQLPAVFPTKARASEAKSRASSKPFAPVRPMAGLF
jgi:hypothetical protein